MTASVGCVRADRERWRAEALEGLRGALHRGTGRSEREVELEKENKLLRQTVTDGAIVRRC